MLKICITGHRNLSDNDSVRREIALSFEYFKKKHKNESPVAVSAIAEGADTIFAEEAIKAQIPLQIVLPFSRAKYEEDFSRKGLESFNALLIDREPEIFHELKTDKKEERDTAYLETGKKLVDDAKIVVAVWDGEPADGKGGTGDIVEYARKQGKELHIIYAAKKNAVLHEIDADFITLDKSAIRYKKAFTRVWIAGIMTGISAVLVFALGLVYHEEIHHDLKFPLAAIEIVYTALSFVLLTYIANWLKNAFLKKRRNAEYLRTVVWHKNAGIPIAVLDNTEYEVHENVSNHEKKISEDIKVISNLRNALRSTWCLAEGQIRYHKKNRIELFEKYTEYMEMCFDGLKIIFFNIVFTKFFLECLEHYAHAHIPHITESKHLYDVLLITIPTIYAALEGVKYFGEWKRNIIISEEITEKLEVNEKDILSCSNDKELVELAKNLRENMELENSAWAIRLSNQHLEKAP